MNKQAPTPTEPPLSTIGATVQIVIDTLFARIKAEEYPTDTRLPSERTLAAELGVARNTVREALDVLEAQNADPPPPRQWQFRHLPVLHPCRRCGAHIGR